jgi:hypothetical protein
MLWFELMPIVKPKSIKLLEVTLFAIRNAIFADGETHALNSQPLPSTMSQFRAKRLDIGCFINKWVIRDHTKRKVYAEYETERCVL